MAMESPQQQYLQRFGGLSERVLGPAPTKVDFPKQADAAAARFAAAEPAARAPMAAQQARMNIESAQKNYLTPQPKFTELTERLAKVPARVLSQPVRAGPAISPRMRESRLPSERDFRTAQWMGYPIQVPTRGRATIPARAYADAVRRHELYTPKIKMGNPSPVYRSPRINSFFRKWLGMRK